MPTSLLVSIGRRLPIRSDLMEELFRAVRHDTLKAIENGEKLIKALVGRSDKASEALRDGTERLVKHLKEELERWETKYKKAKATS